MTPVLTIVVEGVVMSQDTTQHRTQVTQPEARPLGPDSLTWKHFGDWRGLLLGPWAGSLQNMHPQLGAAVEHHSIFFKERWQRLFRSLYPINGVVFDRARAPATARQVRDYHRGISGIDDKGRKYNALDPGTFFWAHSTFVMSIVVVNEYWGTPLTDAEKEQLWGEGLQWYALYGMPMRDLPATWAQFQRYWNDMCEHVLEDNKATRGVLDLSELDKPPNLGWLPDQMWKSVLRPITQRVFIWITVGMYDESVRRLLGYRWGPVDEVALRAVGRMVRYGWSLVPPRLRAQPRRWDALQRVKGKVPVDAPLVEAPDKFQPPPEYRDSPNLYVPSRHRA
jgi:uncharacterized protein (DUF2236 family)